MTRYLLFLILPFMALQANLPFWASVPETLTTIDDFIEDSWYDIYFFVVLSDDTCWCLEKGEEETKQWAIGDTIHVMKDDSFFTFTSDYIFQLYNHTRDQTADVHLTNFGENPLIIVDDTFQYPTKFVSEGGFRDDDNQLKATDYKKQVTLSNGTTWEIEASLFRFKPGKNVYIGYNEYEERYFLITRKFRNSVWSWAKKID